MWCVSSVCESVWDVALSETLHHSAFSENRCVISVIYSLFVSISVFPCLSLPPLELWHILFRIHFNATLRHFKME